MTKKIYIYHWIASPLSNPDIIHTQSHMKNHNFDWIENRDIIYNDKYKLFRVVSDKLTLKQAIKVLNRHKEILEVTEPGQTVTTFLKVE